MLVRGPGLAASMSRYLIDRIAAAPNIELLPHTEIVALSGTPEGQLERVRWRNNRTGEEQDKPIRNVFLFIGADPATDWLADCGVAMDPQGFVRTGAAIAPAASAAPRRTSSAAIGIEHARGVCGGRRARPARSSASAAASAKAPRWWRNCIRCLPTRIIPPG